MDHSLAMFWRPQTLQFSFIVVIQGSVAIYFNSACIRNYAFVYFL